MPIITFFASKYFVFDTILSLTSVQSNIYAAVAAVITLHAALGLFLYRAYFDTSSYSSFDKQD